MTTASLRSVYPGPGGFDPRALRREFPIFANNPELVFLDSGASAQKPRAVIDRIADYYRTDYANVHRGVYRLSARSTELFEEAREKVRRFLNAADPREIVFVRNTTEAINLVAQSWGPAFLQPGDEVLISVLEHHSNIVPWQLLRDRIGIRLVVTPLDATGGLDLADFEARLSARRDHPRRQFYRSGRSGRNDRTAGAPAGRQGADRRQPSSASDAGRRTGARLRLLRPDRP
jgi:cysteine desulfurase/selenocysteine lyase